MRRLSAEEEDYLKKKIKAAAYIGIGGVDVQRLFGYRGEELSFEDFAQIIRGKGKLPIALVSEEMLRALFERVDLDGGGTIDVQEFEAFLLDKEVPNNDEEKIRAKDPAVAEAECTVAAAQESIEEATARVALALSKQSSASRAVEAQEAAIEATNQRAREALRVAQEAVEAAGKKEKEEAEQKLEALREHHKLAKQSALQKLPTMQDKQRSCEKQAEAAEAQMKAAKTELKVKQDELSRTVKKVVERKYNEAREQFFGATGDRDAMLMMKQVELLNGGVYRESSRLIHKLSNSLAATIHFRQTGKRLEQPAPKVEKVGNWLQGRLRKIYTTDAVASVRQACKSVEDSRAEMKEKADQCTSKQEIVKQRQADVETAKKSH